MGTYACAATVFVATVGAIITLSILGLFTQAAAVIGPAIRDVNEFLAQFIVFGGAAFVVAIIGILGCLSRGPEEVRSMKPLAVRGTVKAGASKSPADSSV